MTVQSKFTRILFLVTLSLSLYANDILTDYRNNGIENIEKRMDAELTKVAYWRNYLKKFDTTFGYLESYSNILTCDKDKSTLCMYVKNKNNKYKLQDEYGAYTGKNKGDKFTEGDLKTPTGIYNITEKIKKLDSFYGPLAFVISYPNTYDKYKGRDGHGIWIHGLPTDQKRDNFTKGCIAINNKDIECLDKSIDINNTLLIINKEEVSKKVSKEELSTLLAQLFQWRYTWLYNDIENYLNFYSKEFVRFDKMTYNNFIIYKKRIFSKQEKKKILFSDINILPYPSNNSLYKITFKEFYKSSSFEFSGDKVLMVKLINNKIKIITEK